MQFAESHGPYTSSMWQKKLHETSPLSLNALEMCSRTIHSICVLRMYLLETVMDNVCLFIGIVNCFLLGNVIPENSENNKDSAKMS